MNNDRFTLDLSNEFFIYGAGGDGVKIANFLCAKGYRLLAFIDKRAKDLNKIDTIPVISLKEAGGFQGEKESKVVIITLKNVFEHSMIASRLFDRGFRNIIYKPVSIFKPIIDKEALSIGKVYDRMLKNLPVPRNTKLPKMKENKCDYHDSLLIYDDEDTGIVTAWTPIELIFNYEKEYAYEDLNMAVFFPLVDLYRCLIGTTNLDINKCIDAYIIYASEFLHLNNIKMTESMKDSLVESRVNIFSHMMKAVESSIDFFIRNAVLADSKGNCHLNITSSGRNRISFIIARGYRLVPLKMSRAAYKTWQNEQQYENVVAYIKGKNLKRAFAPIAHPKLINLPVIAENYYDLFVFKLANIIIRELYNKSISEDNNPTFVEKDKLKKHAAKKLIICAIDDNGGCSRYLKSIGLHVMRLNERKISEVSYGFTQVLDDLFYIENIETLNSHELKDLQVDTVIFDNRNSLDTIKELLSVTKANAMYINWSSKAPINPEEYGFLRNEKLFTTLWDQDIVEGIHFQNPGE